MAAAGPLTRVQHAPGMGQRSRRISRDAVQDAAMTKITKTALVEQLAQDTGLSKKDADKAVSGLVKLMAGHLTSGTSVGLTGLGTFSVKDTAARTGVRPGTTEKIQIPAGRKVSFKVADDLKKSL